MSLCCSAVLEVQAVPALPPVLLQVVREAETQTHGTGQGQDCWGGPWHGTAPAPSCVVSQAEGHQPEGDSDPHDEHSGKKCSNVSAEGAVEA